MVAHLIRNDAQHSLFARRELARQPRRERPRGGEGAAALDGSAPVRRLL
jgi:hypothetical protein